MYFFLVLFLSTSLYSNLCTFSTVCYYRYFSHALKFDCIILLGQTQHLFQNVIYLILSSEISKVYVSLIKLLNSSLQMYSAVQNLPDHQSITPYLQPRNTVNGNDDDDDDDDETHLPVHY
jgi:hypothetical protein